MKKIIALPSLILSRIHMGANEALFHQWGKCIYVLEYVLKKRRDQYVGLETELTNKRGHAQQNPPLQLRIFSNEAFESFCKTGAKRLLTNGDFNNLLAFINTDKTIVVVIQNDSDQDKPLSIKTGNKFLNPTLQAHSFNTIVIQD